MKIVEAFGRTLAQKQNQKGDEYIEEPRLDLLEKNEVEAKRPSMWNIVFYNDYSTPMDFVEFILKRVFHLPTLDALALTLVVHTKVKALLAPIRLRSPNKSNARSY